MSAGVVRDLSVGIAPAAIGIAIVVCLVAAVVYGYRARAREPAPPREPQPRGGAWQTPEERESAVPPDRGVQDPEADPVGYEETSRGPEEVPRDGHRRTPHELRHYPGPRT
ncbi:MULTISPECIES: DUF6479 family protein [Streptomyces]|uniref:DUF6479 family protein n=1 Tax=Streptomyces silvisoli TaxID=3034235 RepID=A0ABT5ZE47_9ACTN|nr:MULTISPECIES: DUF6479 family protein [Streptomyces]MDF3288104.1 DUF6479 family protein [Streptomyces silvisoli]